MTSSNSMSDAPSHIAFQPRYVAYCDAHGMSPEAMLASDIERFPGGCMTGYMLWIRDQWAEWRRMMNYPASEALSSEKHAHFDEWLAERVRAARASASGARS